MTSERASVMGNETDLIERSDSGALKGCHCRWNVRFRASQVLVNRRVSEEHGIRLCLKLRCSESARLEIA